MSKERERVVCVSLSDAEWKALTERHPEPVDWLRQQILSEIGVDASAHQTVRTAQTVFSTRRV